ncbi:MAG TPA: nucleotidyltransferase family protein [Acidimicrobiia bacterium]|nr:nucleotidyltransferase family protein [Acidimicrobiia bacterium]
MVRSRTARAEVMRRCVAGTDAGALAADARPGALDTLPELAAEHGVIGAVFQQLGPRPELDPAVRRRLASAVLQNRLDHARIASDLNYLAGIFESLPTPWLIVKGPAVAATLYCPPELRAAGDIDVLIVPEHFAGAIELLERAGHPIDDANWPLVRRLTAGQLHIVLPGGTPLDLHWHLLFAAEERRRYRLTTEELVERARPATIAGAELLTLDPVDTLVHLCFHAANEGADRLGWLSDVARAAAVPGLDWDEVVARATAWRMQLPVATVLQRSAQELGAPVPLDVRKRLAPFGWRALMRVADRTFPVARTPRRMGNPASLLAKSSAVAVTPARAVGSAASGLARRSLHAARTGDAARIERWDEQRDTSLAYRAEFDERDRTAYFAAVAAEAAAPCDR